MHFQQSAPAAAARASGDTAFNDALAHVTDLEAAKKYEDAIGLLRQIVAVNLQSAEVHHRLAVNLLASGKINESISEFRIASALRPEKKEYATDLASALSIHRRSQEAESGSDTTAAAVASTPEVAR